MEFSHLTLTSITLLTYKIYKHRKNMCIEFKKKNQILFALVATESGMNRALQ